MSIPHFAAMAALTLFTALAPTTAWAGGGTHTGIDYTSAAMLFGIMGLLAVVAIIVQRFTWGKNGSTGLMVLRQFAVFLILGSFAAQVWANVDYTSYEHFIHAQLFYLPLVEHAVTPHFFINDGPLMVSFFGVAAAELSEAIMSKNGGLHGSKIWLPLGGCIGGVVMPIVVYRLTSTPELAHGYPVSMATDIAFAWLGARILFGNKHPATIFLLAFAVLDDFVGMGYIAVMMPQHPFNAVGLALLAGALMSSFSLRKMSQSESKVINYLGNQWWTYILVGGTFAWYGLYLAGLHPALALVFVVPFMPMAPEDEGMYEHDTEHKDHSTMGNFKHMLEAPIDVGLALFGLMNAGVWWIGKEGAWTQDSTAVLTALMVGKTIGVVLFTGIMLFAIRALVDKKAGLPSNEHGTITWPILGLVGLLGGCGFTVALFMVDAGNLPDSLRLGALFSLVCLPIALVIGRFILKNKDLKQEPADSMPPMPKAATGK